MQCAGEAGSAGLPNPTKTAGEGRMVCFSEGVIRGGEQGVRCGHGWGEFQYCKRFKIPRRQRRFPLKSCGAFGCVHFSGAGHFFGIANQK